MLHRVLCFQMPEKAFSQIWGGTSTQSILMAHRIVETLALLNNSMSHEVGERVEICACILKANIW